MTKPNVTTEEMRNHFDSMVRILPSIARDEQCEICEAIRALIEHGPEVSSKQIEDICIILLACDWPRQKYVLEEWLIAKGVTVKEVK